MVTYVLPLPFNGAGNLHKHRPCLICTRLTILVRSSPGPLKQNPFHQRLFPKPSLRLLLALKLRSQKAEFMRIPHAGLVVAILFVPLALHAAQAPAPGTPQQAAPPPPVPTASETLKPALVGVLQTLGSLKLDKWKRGSVREEAGSNIDTIQRDLEETLPALIKTADAAPTTISKVLPVTRNVDAIYDVLVHVFEAARVSAPGDQIAQLQQAMDNLEKARIKLDNHLEETAAAQEKLVADLRTTVQTQQASLHAAAATPPVTPTCPAPAPAHKKKRATPATTTSTSPTTTAPKKPATSTPSAVTPPATPPKTP